MGPVLDAGGRKQDEKSLFLCTCPLSPRPGKKQFAKSGNPNGVATNNADPLWDPYGSAAQDSVAIFNITAAGAVNVTMASGIRRSFCSFWGSNVLPEVRQSGVSSPDGTPRPPTSFRSNVTAVAHLLGGAGDTARLEFGSSRVLLAAIVTLMSVVYHQSRDESPVRRAV